MGKQLDGGKLLAIVGPTATGKTGISLRLAKEWGADILCVDSRTIYRHMDIGTAKPTSEERAQIVHYGLDLINPGDEFSVYDFCKYARPIVNDYQARGKPLILVGGSGMYFDALIFDYRFRDFHIDWPTIEAMSDDEVERAVQQQYPELIDSYDVKNTRRLRQLLAKGPANTDDRKTLKYPMKIIGLKSIPDRHKQTIANRTKNMLNQGFVQEVEMLQMRYGDHCPQLQTTGYGAVMKYLHSKGPISELVAAINSQTWQLVRKQRTWFRRNPHIEWHDSDESGLVEYLLTLSQ